MNHSLDIECAHTLVRQNRRRLEEGDEALTFFIWNEFRIHDPFLDCTGRFPVDPVEEYGEVFLQSDFYRSANGEEVDKDT